MDDNKTARIGKYNPEQGFGFLLEPDETRWFFHITDCHGFLPRYGMTVTFQIGANKKGPCAVNLNLVGGGQ